MQENNAIAAPFRKSLKGNKVRSESHCMLSKMTNDEQKSSVTLFRGD